MTYVLMKIFESSPERYDKGINIISFGRIAKYYDRITSDIKKGDHVLDIGCGTGLLLIRALKRGAEVKGIDINPEMLLIARKKVEKANFYDMVDLVEMGVAELDTEPSDYYDYVMSGLCFSELSENELIMTLKESYRILKKMGKLIVVDEIIPSNPIFRLLNWLIRLPLVIITYIFTQTTTKSISNLKSKIENSGFKIIEYKEERFGNFAKIIAIKKEVK